MYAIIGGSGLSQLAELEVLRREIIRTPYGEPSAPLLFGRLAGREVVFLPRHGHGHSIAPHEVNYRANMWALHAQGLSGVISVASVGGIRADMAPGALAVPDQIIDYTWGRPSTFFEGRGKPVTHIDFTQPYDQQLRLLLLAAAAKCEQAIAATATYATTQGPRLETAAEINRLERDGSDLVGMTGMPEAALARELELPYAAIAVVANWAAGRATSSEQIDLDAIRLVLEVAMGKVRRIIETFLQSHD